MDILASLQETKRLVTIEDWHDTSMNRNINPSQDTLVLEIIETLIIKEKLSYKARTACIHFLLEILNIRDLVWRVRMPLWVASTNNIKVRSLFLDELDQVRCVAEILLWFHIRDNIPTQGQDFLYPNFIKSAMVSATFSLVR